MKICFVKTRRGVSLIITPEDNSEKEFIKSFPTNGLTAEFVEGQSFILDETFNDALIIKPEEKKSDEKLSSQ